MGTRTDLGEGLMGRPRVLSTVTEMTTVPAGYRLKVVGDYYYDGTGDFRVQIVKK